MRTKAFRVGDPLVSSPSIRLINTQHFFPVEFGTLVNSFIAYLTLSYNYIPQVHPSCVKCALHANAPTMMA